MIARTKFLFSYTTFMEVPQDEGASSQWQKRASVSPLLAGHPILVFTGYKNIWTSLPILGPVDERCFQKINFHIKFNAYFSMKYGIVWVLSQEFFLSPLFNFYFKNWPFHEF